jgi:hypothetical protein
MYKYDEVINVVTNKFPQMKEVFEKDEEYYEDLPYVFYESEFVQFIVENANSGNNETLQIIFEIVENLIEFGDEKVVNLIEVAVVESLFLDKRIKNKSNLLEFFGRLTMNSYSACIKQQ